MPELNTAFEPNLLRMLVRFCLMALVFTVIEQLFALHRSQAIFRQGYVTDIFHFFASHLLVNFGFGLLATIFISFANTSEWLNPIRSWVSVLSPVIQMPFALAIILFSDYWEHRLAHTWKWRWRFHAIHHTTTQMDWLASVRSHPLDQILHRSFTFLPVLMLNFSIYTLAPVFVVAAVMGIVDHVNVRITFPKLINRLFATPQYHHWHHAREPIDKNFGAMSPLMDQIFGTYYLPKGKWPSKYGIDTEIAENYWTHLIAPFSFRRS